MRSQPEGKVVTARIQTSSFLNDDIHLKCFVSFFRWKVGKKPLHGLKAIHLQKIKMKTFTNHSHQQKILFLVSEDILELGLSSISSTIKETPSRRISIKLTVFRLQNLHLTSTFFFIRPRSIYQYSNTAPRPNFYVLPQLHVTILIYRTWSIGTLLQYKPVFIM